MPEVSAAIIVLAGAVLVVAGSIPSSMTNESRQTLVGAGRLVATLGMAAWLIAFIIALMRIAHSWPS